ncbi:hypothetical protein BJX99DRAFT_257148 [Aspergillus californicus]
MSGLCPSGLWSLNCARRLARPASPQGEPSRPRPYLHPHPRNFNRESTVVADYRFRRFTPSPDHTNLPTLSAVSVATISALGSLQGYISEANTSESSLSSVFTTESLELLEIYIKETRTPEVQAAYDKYKSLEVDMAAAHKLCKPFKHDKDDRVTRTEDQARENVNLALLWAESAVRQVQSLIRYSTIKSSRQTCFLS